MEGLLSHHPSSSHSFSLPVDAHPYPSRSSSHVYAQKPVYPPQSGFYDQSFAHHQHHHQNQPRFPSAPQSLQIQTATPAPHEHEPEEQTAHPSRAVYHQLTQDADLQDGTDLLDEPEQQQSIADALTDNSGPHGGLTRALTLQERELLAHLDRLKFFLATAPSRWNSENGFAGPDPSTVPVGHPHSAHPALNRFLLPNSEYVSCVLWGGLYHITGTDIVRALVFRFEAFGRPVRNMKKFEEGVFSDLRNLKPGVDACLEEPKSPFLDLLFKYQCIRTQKKQKVFYWFSVPHDRLFLDALERDLKREKMGLEPTTVVVGEPALSFTYDSKRSLYEQFAKASGNRDGEGELEAAVRHADESQTGDDSDKAAHSGSDAEQSASEADDSQAEDSGASAAGKKKKKLSAMRNTHSPFFSMFSLFEGSPTYKQRRKKVPKARKSPTGLDHPHGLHPLAHSHDDEYAHGLTGPYGYREPHRDRFGRETMRLSAEDMFRAQARGDFGGQSNPDLIVTQKERQRRALDELVTLTGAGAAGHSKPSYLSGLTGPGVSGGGLPAAAGASGLVYGMVGAPLSASQVTGASMSYSPQQQAQQQFTQQQQQQQITGRPHLEQRHTYPMIDYAQQQPHTHSPMRSETDPYSVVGAHQPLTNGWAAAGAEAILGAPRTKAFVCPLFSCGRMFKRMEHLKRHLRTHTLERPFQCDRCKKRFSRSDNLAQHIRTHERRAAAAASGLPLPAGETEGEEDVDELETDDIDRHLRNLPGVNGITSVQMCEVEVQGQVHDVQGDEEGLVTATGPIGRSMAAAAAVSESAEQAHGVMASQDMFYDHAAPTQHFNPSGQVMRASPETSPYMHTTNSNSPEAQWATVPVHPRSQQPSPTSSLATSTGLATRLNASYHTHGNAVGEYVTSISAPSHKLTFDHTALYPQELALNGPGPIRRHRSATPSLTKYGESIRRPYSAALSESGQSAVSSVSGRSYHPYAVPGHHVSHSAQSSPMAYTVPLGYDGSHPPSRHHSHPHPHSHSRSNSGGQLQEQMHQMLSLGQVNADTDAAMAYGSQQGAAAAPGGYQGMYRTDSPMPFSGPAETFGMDIAAQHQPTGMSGSQDINVGVQGMYAVGMADAQAAQYASGFYPPQSHHSL